MQDRRRKRRTLTELPFIASQPLIVQLTQQVAAQQIAIAQLRDRYRDKHPKMIQAREFARADPAGTVQAVDAAAAAVEADYQTALRNNLAARQALAAQETDSLKLDRYAVDYDNLERQYEVNEKLLDQILSRMSETSVTGTIETQSARIVDRACRRRSRPFFPTFRSISVWALSAGSSSAWHLPFSWRSSTTG